MIKQHPAPTHLRPDTLGGDRSLEHAGEPSGPAIAPRRKQPVRGMSYIMAQEEERQWIALEVHDRIAQTLAAVFQQLQVLESITQADPRALQAAIRASALLREAIREARNIMNDLHPPILGDLGVVPLMEEELRHFQRDTGCKATLLANYLTRPSRETEVALYRIFHEALINVRRHARATAVVVSLHDGPGTVQLRIQDDGVGFNVGDARKKKLMGGLICMQRRAEMAGGICRIESTPGQGAAIEIRIPLAVQSA